MRIGCGLAAAAVLSGLGCTAALAAQPDSAYFGIGGGGVLLPDQTLTGGVEIESDPGWMAAGTLGLRWKGGWRMEVEGAYRRNDASLPGVSGDLASSSIVVNALRSLDMGWGLIPYIGAGIGTAQVNYKLDVPASDKKDTGFLWQLIGGAAVPVSNAFELFADYRYFDTFSIDAHLGGVEPDDSYRGHTVMAGLRWTFYTASEPMPAAAPAPAPVAAPKDYVIYFEFDKAAVTDAAGAVLDELKATAGGGSVSVVGHTDTSGATAYNQKLSDQRAANTADALTSRGVPVDSVSGRGESEPAVQTGDGVKEPLNRRAVIKLNSAAVPTQ